MIRNAKFPRAAALLACLPLCACGDIVWNQISGTPNWNVPITLEGTWEGFFYPGQYWRRADPAKGQRQLGPCITNGGAATLVIDGGVVQGTVVMEEGARLTVRGTTAVGSPISGDNLVAAELLRDGKRVGRMDLEPNGYSGQLFGHYRIDLDPRTYGCGAEVFLDRARN